MTRMARIEKANPGPHLPRAGIFAILPHMDQMVSDTNPEVERKLIELLRQMPPAKKLRLMARLNRMLRDLALSEIRAHYPQASEAEIRVHLIERIHGPEIAEKVSGSPSNSGKSKMSDNPNEDPLEVALLVTTVFERHGIPYYVGGSVASTFYGKVRGTHDIDLIADLKPEHAAVLVKELGERFYVDAQMILDAISHQSSFNLLHNESAYKVDVFIPRVSASSEMRFRRRVQRPVREDARELIYLSSPEDLILSKIEWYELGHRVSDRQWTDIIGVIKAQADTLDRDYLARWAAELGLADLLERAYRDAE